MQGQTGGNPMTGKAAQGPRAGASSAGVPSAGRQGVQLGVWFEAEWLSDHRAGTRYEALQRTATGGERPQHPRVEDFHRELTGLFPQTSDAWAAPLACTSTGMLVSMVPGRAEEVSEVIRNLTMRHGLVCYDPRAGGVTAPRSIAARQRLTLSCCDGSRWADPGDGQVEQVLRGLSDRNWFALLERDSGGWLQVGFGEPAGAPPDGYLLEQHDGVSGPDAASERHEVASCAELTAVIRACQQFARADASWSEPFTWRTVELELSLA